TGTARDVTQSIRAEEALSESAERFRLMIEGSEQVIFYIHDIDHRFEYLSPSTLPVLGYEPNELLGQLYDTLLISGDPENDTVHEKTDQALRDGKPLPLYNIAVHQKNGGRIVLEIQESPIFRDGVVVGMQGFGRDITARKLAEDETRRSANLLQAVADSTSDAVFVKDLQGRYLLFNEGAAHLVGKPVAEVLGHDDTEIFDLEGARTMMESDREVMRSGQITVAEEDLTAAGVARIYHVTKAPYRDSQGKIIGLVGISRDITKRRQADEMLRQNQTMLRIAGSAAKLGGWSIDLADNKLSWSDETAIIHDLEPGNTPTLEEAIAYYPSEHREAVSEHVRLIVTDGTPFDFEVELITARQRRIWVRAIGEAMRDNAGKIVRIYGAFQDITEQKQADLALIASNRALQLLSRCNEALIRSESETSLLRDICRIATEVGDFRLAWVGYAQDDAGKTIKPQAYSGEGHEYLTDLRVSWSEDGPSGQGPAGRVIRSGKPLVIPDLSQEPSFAPWLNKTKAHGFAGIVALPLKNQTRTFGVLILYTGKIHTPHVNEMQLLRELADDLAFGIGTLRSQVDRRRMEVAIQKMAASVSASTNQNFFYQLATNMAEALGAQAAFVSRLLPGQPLTARTIAAVIDGDLVKNFDYKISGTPCEALMSGNDCIVTERLAEQFPEAAALKELGAEAYVGRRLLNADGETTGFLFALHRKPLEHSEFVSSTLQVFATRANAELERRKSDARLREQASLLDKARDAILVRNLDHTILYWNQSAERLYGWTAAEAIGRSAIDLFYHNTKDYLIPVESTLTTGEWQGELQQCTKAGALVAVEARWTLVRDDQGEPQSILAINTDITERKKLEQQFLRAQRMESIGTLAGGIAHDLNNVLAPIMMSIELLKIQEKDPRRLSVLNTIETSSKRGADMVKQVLSFARGVESQQLEVQAGHLLTEIEKLANETFLKNIQVRSIIPPDLWIVRGDPTQLHQVLLNLCVNARDAMPYGGTLSLAASNLMLDEHYAGMNIEAKPGPHVRIVVEDTGTGMPPEVIERIFEPFFTTKELGKGTGLGLSTTIAIIKSHGGFLRVYSEVGVGTRFHVYLPAQTEPGAANMGHLEVELPGGQGQLILVIDDEASIRQITQQTLEAFGYRVVLASDGAEAAAIYGVRRHEIAAVLTDMMMPVMDGPATIQVLMRMNPQVRIIAASGLNANGMVAKAVNVGVKHFIPKPYTAETLLKTLHTLLNETNATR
ncbi:PAS domain S-box protein, partial [Prosthecobacter sp.]|uniref:PAS domain S-box protein n=1 Tax=Prosthecobacter sp. TaxID=1965333 RepID=UPI002488B1CA